MTAVHPDVQALLTLIREAGRPRFETLSPVAARQAYAAGRSLLQPPPEDVADCYDLQAPGASGPLALRYYRGTASATGHPLPCLLYLHGGGWVLGDLDSHDGVCRTLANHARCIVIAVDYRLAPEHPFPAAVEDAASALVWIVRQASSLGIDPARIAVGGDSAGGNLAAVLALMGRDGVVPASMFQLLFYPVTDLAMTGESYQRVSPEMPLNAASMRYFVDHYAPVPADRTDWRASPLRAASLQGAPPALVLSCGHDPLCDEARHYAARLEREGVPVTALHLSDQTHGILTMGKAIKATEAVLAFAGIALRQAWREQA